MENAAEGERGAERRTVEGRAKAAKASCVAGLIVWASNEPNFRHRPTDQHSYQAAEEHFGHSVQPALDSNPGGRARETSSNDYGCGDWSLSPHGFDPDEIGGDQNGDGQRYRNHSLAATADDDKDESNTAANQHIDDSTMEKLARLLRFRVGGRNQRCDCPDGICIADFSKSEPNYGCGEQNVHGEAEPKGSS